MTRICTSFLAAAALSLLCAACADPVAQLEKYDPQSVDFASALAGEYLQFAEAEKELKHDEAARYFGAKGLTATQGYEVEPEAVPPHLPDSGHAALTQARARLVRALGKKAREIEILKAARAQMMFDCWAHEASLSRTESAATCREAFLAAIAELERAVRPRAIQKH